jgi:DNA repair photolyase
MKTVTAKLCSGISRSKAFEEKGLAQYAVNVGLKCGHACTYCSSNAMLRIQLSKLGIKGFNKDCCVVDPDTPTRVEQDAKNKRNRGVVQLCTIADAWSPEAQEYSLGRKCLEAILSQPGWTVRVLTKNAAVAKDFDLVEKYKDRVLVGLSITATPEKNDIIAVVEPNASPIAERLEVLQQAHSRGLRTYGMLCPLLPGIADSPCQIDELVKYMVDCGVEEIFAEAVNPRGRGLILTQQALEKAGYHNEAKAVEAIRRGPNWSAYVVNLIKNLQQGVRKYSDINKLRFLLYPKGLQANDLEAVKQDDAGVVWLGSKT